MTTHRVITVEAAIMAYKQMKQQGRRLPWALAEARLCDIEANL